MTEHPGSAPPLEVDGRRPAVEWVTSLPREWANATERLVLLCLASDSFDGVTSAPTTAALMGWTGLYKGTLLRNLARLCAPTDVRPPLLVAARSGGRRRTVYTFTLARPASRREPVSPVGPDADPEPVSPVGPVAGSPTGLTNRSHEPVSPVGPLPTLSLEVEEDARASEPDDDPEAGDPPDVAAWWLIVRAADLLGCTPDEWPKHEHPSVIGLVDQVATAIRQGHGPDAIFQRLMCGYREGLWPAPAHVKSWPSLLGERFRDFATPST